MQEILSLFQDIIDNGTDSTNRTGEKSRKVFGRHRSFDLSKGFPFPTTRETYLRGVIVELLWFIDGDTNIKRLVDNNVHIWDEWALTEEHLAMLSEEEIPYTERLEMYINQLNTERNYTEEEAAESRRSITLCPHIRSQIDNMNAAGIRKYHTYGELGFKVGDLGPVYGKMWRQWPSYNGTIDQIAKVQSDLINRPTSRRIIVSAWNPAVLPDESVSPQMNVLNGRQALAPCHTMFQLATADLSVDERTEILRDNHELFQDYMHWSESREMLNMSREECKAAIHEKLSELGIAKYRLNLLVYCRSQDVPLGTPFNIAGYALLCMMFAKTSNMVPGTLHWVGGDVHYYLNQRESMDLQLTRTPTESPRIILHGKQETVFDFKLEDFELVDYRPQAKIKYPKPAV